MKKTSLVILLCIFMFVFVSCSQPYEFSQDISDPSQIQIQIVCLESGIDQYDSPYNEENITVIKIIEKTKAEAFLSHFKNIKSYHPFGDPIGRIAGEAIRIIYPNGSIELITDYGTATVIKGETNIQTITFDSDDFAELLDKYS